MTLYTFALFLHVVGAVLLGTSNALLLAGLIQVRRASTVEELRLWSGLARASGRITPLAALLLLVPGVYLVFDAWGWAIAWIDASLTVVVFLALLGRFALGPRLAALSMGVRQTTSGPISDTLHQRRTNRALWTAAWTSTALYLGVVFLMTTKPDLTGTLVTVAVAILAGIVLPFTMGSPVASATSPSVPRQAPAAAGVDGER